jgi:serine/threonine protein kinase
MGDFPPEWQHVRDLTPGGQGYTYVVRRAKNAGSQLFVLKRLKNINRKAYFDREIRACMALQHPNVLKIIENGETPKGLPYLISEYCEAGSLNTLKPFHDPLVGLQFFAQIVEGVAQAHCHLEPIYHLDLKPENILLKGDTPVVGDFGICFIEDGEYNLTADGPRGPIYYCAPELRGRKIASGVDLARADIYSLGKVFFWLFTGEVYDGHEDDYGGGRLFKMYPKEPHFVLIDELIVAMIMKDPASRIKTAADLLDRVADIIRRIIARANVLNLDVPQHCLYCAIGHYRAAHQITPMGHVFSNFPVFPNRAARRNPPAPPINSSRDSIYERLRHVARAMFGMRDGFGSAAPMFLVCDHCGNVQYFRLDYTQDNGGNWLP